MMPQSTFMIVAEIRAERLGDLRALLESMNIQSGIADSVNSLVPFGQFHRLHVARFVIVEAKTGDDIRAHGVTPRPWPPTLVFLGDCDGPYETFLAELAVRAGPGLREIFSHCDGFTSDDRDLLGWMKIHNQRPSANYINWLGRTVTQVHEETALHEALATHLKKIIGEVGSGNTRARNRHPVERSQRRPLTVVDEREPPDVLRFATNSHRTDGLLLSREGQEW